MAEVNGRLASLGDRPSDEQVTELALTLVQHACAERLAAEALISQLILRDDSRAARRAAEAMQANGELEEE